MKTPTPINLVLAGTITVLAFASSAKAQHAYPGGASTKAQIDLTKKITDTVRKNVEERNRQMPSNGSESEEMRNATEEFGKNMMPEFEKQLQAGLAGLEKVYKDLEGDNDLLRAAETYAKSLNNDQARTAFLGDIVKESKARLDNVVIYKQKLLDEAILNVYRSLGLPLYFAKVIQKRNRAKIFSFLDGEYKATVSENFEPSGESRSNRDNHPIYAYVAEEAFLKIPKAELFRALDVSDQKTPYKDLYALYVKKVQESSKLRPINLAQSTRDGKGPYYGENVVEPIMWEKEVESSIRLRARTEQIIADIKDPVERQKAAVPITPEEQLSAITKIVSYEASYNPVHARNDFLDFALKHNRTYGAVCKTKICVSQLSGYLINVFVNLRSVVHASIQVWTPNEVQEKLGMKPVILKPAGFIFLPTLQALIDDKGLVDELTKRNVPIFQTPAYRK